MISIDFVCRERIESVVIIYPGRRTLPKGFSAVEQALRIITKRHQAAVDSTNDKVKLELPPLYNQWRIINAVVPAHNDFTLANWADCRNTPRFYPLAMACREDGKLTAPSSSTACW